jgi:hypothetical protein
MRCPLCKEGKLVPCHRFLFCLNGCSFGSIWPHDVIELWPEKWLSRLWLSHKESKNGPHGLVDYLQANLPWAHELDFIEHILDEHNKMVENDVMETLRFMVTKAIIQQEIMPFLF